MSVLAAAGKAARQAIFHSSPILKYIPVDCHVRRIYIRDNILVCAMRYFLVKYKILTKTIQFVQNKKIIKCKVNQVDALGIIL